ncbi:MAG: hypothetical protein H0T76_22080 [Nannocystis sp.]|nr:hypothetical protein [Nannocystis sp.]MBA3549170.1 hypothetical protein [Nannocystis sp.]
MGLVAGGACQPSGADTTSGDDSEGETQGCVAGSLNCLCGEGDSCEPGLVCASMRCVDDGTMSTSGTGQVTTTDPTTMPATMTGMETSGDSSSSTGDTGGLQCEPADGGANAACDDPAEPYCSVDGACVGCTEIDCAGASPTTPACGAAGVCVECTDTVKDACAGIRPVCDVEASACVGCSEHGQCESGACDLDTGACFTTTLYVDRASPCEGDGSPATPFCEIADAVAKVNSNTPTVVRVKPSASPYIKKVDVGSNLKVVIMRDGAGTARLEVDGADSMQLNDGATAYLQNLQISKGTVNKGILCLAGTVWLERSQIIERKGLAIDGVDCHVKLRASRIYLNLAGGIKLNGGSLSLINSYIVTNGGAFSAVAGITLTNAASLEAVYTTIANNDGKAGVEDSLECLMEGSVTLRNSVLFGKTDLSSVDCAKATASNSVFDAPSLKGAANKIIKELDPSWFVSPETGDFAITGVAPFKDVAMWQSGDPVGDYDDTQRPAMDGAADYAGADRPN